MGTNYNMMNMPKFVVGRNSLGFFATLNRKRIGIIRDRYGCNEAVMASIKACAIESGAEIECLKIVDNEPEMKDVLDSVDAVAKFQPDMILAVGGGSVLDVAKGLLLFYENPDMTFEEATIPFSLPVLGEKAILVAVPTTSGTGSETSSVAAYTDPETKRKRLFMDPHLIPHYAIIDANLAETLPDKVRIFSGMDALTHAIEASVTTNSSLMTKAVGIQAALDILEQLPKTIDYEISVEERALAREKVHVAASMSGVAITNSCTGIVHSYDHPGPYFGYSHGEVCGVMLPYSISFCGVQDSFVTISKRLGYSGSDEELVEKFIQHLFAFTKRLELITSFKDLGIDEAEYMEKAETWAEVSLNAFATVVSPSKMTVEKGMEFYKACYYGEDEK